MLLPDALSHLVNWHPLGLRQQENHEHEHDRDPRGEEEEDSGSHAAHHGQKRLRNDEGEEHVGAHGKRVSRSPRLQRKSLAGDEPSQWTPRPCKPGDEETDEEDHREGKVLVELARGTQLDGEDGSDANLGDEHLHAGLEEKRSSSDLIDEDDGDDGASHVESSDYEGGQQGGVALEAHGLEEHRSVEHYGVDARELLEHLHGYGDDKLGAARALHQITERMLHLASQVAGFDEFFELGVDFRDSSDAPQHGSAFVELSPLDEAGRGFGDEKGAETEDAGRDSRNS